MTREEALKLATIEANNYTNSKSYMGHEWGFSWIGDWYNNPNMTTSFSKMTRSLKPDIYAQSIQFLAEEIFIRNTPLFKALEEND